MRACALLITFTLTSTGHAAPIDDLKGAYANCLRTELDQAKVLLHHTIESKAQIAIANCKGDMMLLAEVDPPKPDANPQVSPSAWAVIETVFGPNSRRRLIGLTF